MPSLPIGVALGFKVVTHITTCRYCMFGILLSEICSIFFYIYIYMCSRFSWNISHTSHLLKDNAYVLVDANACRQKQVYLLNSNAYSQLFSDHPSLYIYIYIHILYLCLFKIHRCNVFFREDSVIYLVGLAAQKLDAKEAGYEGNLGDFVIGLV